MYGREMVPTDEATPPEPDVTVGRFEGVVYRRFVGVLEMDLAVINSPAFAIVAPERLDAGGV